MPASYVLGTAYTSNETVISFAFTSGNRCAKIRRKRILLVQDAFHLPGDAADLPVDAIRYVIDGMAQAGVVVVQAFQAGKQADDAV